MIRDIIQGLGAHGEALAARFDREDGVTAIEYGLIAALIAIVIIVMLTLAGEQLAAIFEQIAAALGADTS